MIVINDETPNDVIFPPGVNRGLEPGDGFASQEGYAGVAEPFPDELLIPRSEWRARIEEIERRGLGRADIARDAGVKIKNQANTNYCWGNSPTWVTELTRYLQGQGYVELSAASVCAQVANFRNVGGWGRNALEWIVEHGIIPVSLWPANAIDRRLASEENRTAGRSFRGQEWWVGESRNYDQFMSALLRGFPVSAGYNWWRHQVSPCQPKWLDGEAAPIIANSWSEAWGERGYGVLQGRRANPDDWCVLRSALPSLSGAA